MRVSRCCGPDWPAHVKTGVVHLIARAGDKRALCGVKKPMPVCVARHAPMHTHIDDWCRACVDAAGMASLLADGRLF